MISKRAYRREPRNLTDFYAKYPSIKKIVGSSGLEQTALLLARKIRSLASEASLPSHFVFPLTMAAANGEVFKGALKVLAPGSRVTFLVTPSSDLLLVPKLHLTKPSADLGLAQLREKISRQYTAAQQALPNLERHLSRVGVENSERIVVVDCHNTRMTIRTTRDVLRKIGFKGRFRQFDPVDFNVLLHDLVPVDPYYGERPSFGSRGAESGNLGWVKDESGASAMSEADALLKNDLRSLRASAKAGGLPPSERREREAVLRANPLGPQRVLYRALKRRHAAARRLYYDLGIAVAKMLLEEDSRATQRKS